MLAKRSHVDAGAQALDAAVGNFACLARTDALVGIGLAVAIRVGTRLQDDSSGQVGNANMDHELFNGIIWREVAIVNVAVYQLVADDRRPSSGWLDILNTIH